MMAIGQRDPGVRRRRGLTVAMLLLLVACFAALETLGAARLRLVDEVRVAAILLLVLVLALRATTAFTLRRRDPALDDELSRANRASAAAWGFWAFFLALAGALAASFFAAPPLRETMLLVLVAGVAAAAIRFVFLERRGE